MTEEERGAGIVCFRIEAPPGECDRLVAELHALGTLGLEEREAPPALLAYFHDDGSARDALLALADPARRVSVHGPDVVPTRDWAAAWRAGLAPRRIGPLWVRPSWCDRVGLPEIVVDPEQAFGSGEHATTRLALQLVVDSLRPGDSLLDLGTGSGILGLAALQLGAGSATGVEIDLDACHNARGNGERNALPLRLVCGTLAALDADARFDLAVANLLLGELEPCLARLASHARRALVLSGYLVSERARLWGALAGVGLAVGEERVETQSGDAWGACLVDVEGHAPLPRPRQSSSTASSVSSKR